MRRFIFLIGVMVLLILRAVCSVDPGPTVLALAPSPTPTLPTWLTIERVQDC